MAKNKSFLENILGKVKNSLQMMGISFSILFKHTEAILFPICSFLIFMLLFSITVVSFIPFFRDHHKPPFILIFIVFVIFIFIGSLFATLSNIGLSHYVSHIFAKKPIHISQSIAISFSKIWIAAQWAVVSAVLLLLLGRRGNQNNMGISSLAGNLLKAGWRLTTFFITPIFAFEDVSLFGGVKESASLMRKTFGETVVASISFSVITKLIVVGAAAAPLAWMKVLNPITGIAIEVLILIIILPIISATRTIFVTAVYNFATGKPTGPFDKKNIKELFGSK